MIKLNDNFMHYVSSKLSYDVPITYLVPKNMGNSISTHIL